MEVELDLPWPPRDVSPNARVHWTKKSKAAKSYRAACYVLASRAIIFIAPGNNIALKITFYPPDSRRRDDDNVIASFKSGRDGIAEAWGVDDTRFRPVTYDWGPNVKGGKITVQFL